MKMTRHRCCEVALLHIEPRDGDYILAVNKNIIIDGKLYVNDQPTLSKIIYCPWCGEKLDENK